MDKSLGGVSERPHPRCNTWSPVVFDLRPSVEPYHLWALPLAALAEVPNAVDTCAEYLDCDLYDSFADF